VSNQLKLPEVARRLGVSEKTARRYVKSGALPSGFVGNAYRVDEEDLEAFLQESKVSPRDDPGKGTRRSSLEPSFNDALEEERRGEDEALAAASMETLAEEGELLEEKLKSVVGEVPVHDTLRFIAAHSLAELIFTEWSRTRQASTELRNAKKHFDEVGERIDKRVRQLLHPGSGAAARERDLFASLRAENRRQGAEAGRHVERERENETA
jgi:excisionase family DNA binding protein